MPALRLWAGMPERFLGIEELLDAAAVPDIVAWLAVDADDHVVAVFQAAPEEERERSVALLVHPARRRAGYGRACVLAAPDQPCYEDLLLRAVIDRENVASFRCFSACGFVPDEDEDAWQGGYADLVHRARPGNRRLRTRPRRRRARAAQRDEASDVALEAGGR